MAYRFVDAHDVEPRLRVLRPIRKALEIHSFGVNEIDLPPNTEIYPEHDEKKSNHDELYVALEGSATMTIDGDEIELIPGRYVFVTPESKRHIAPGADGVRFVAFGVSADHQHEGRH
jgi:mannose-6-phosphate isomerase-like protein (cupin superfamily)